MAVLAGVVAGDVTLADAGEDVLATGVETVLGDVGGALGALPHPETSRMMTARGNASALMPQSLPEQRSRAVKCWGSHS
jgi:hypothetical protein